LAGVGSNNRSALYGLGYPDGSAGRGEYDTIVEVYQLDCWFIVGTVKRACGGYHWHTVTLAFKGTISIFILMVP